MHFQGNAVAAVYHLVAITHSESLPGLLAY